MTHVHARPWQFLRHLVPSKRTCGRFALALVAFTAIFFAGLLGGWATFSA